jgi:hypothetical protein
MSLSKQFNQAETTAKTRATNRPISTAASAKSTVLANKKIWRSLTKLSKSKSSILNHVVIIDKAKKEKSHPENGPAGHRLPAETANVILPIGRRVSTA